MGLIADRLHRLAVALGARRRVIRKANRARDAGDCGQAAALYERALRLAPQDAAIHIQAGHMVKGTGDVAAAERHYRAAIAAAPDDRDGPLHLAHLLKSSGRPREAHGHFRRLAALDAEAGEMAALVDETLVMGSGLFDVEVYRLRNPDLKGANLIRHFLDHGLTEARPASLLFDVEWYLERYPDVRGAAGGPMLDYLRHPHALRDPNPFFSNRAYLAALGARDTGGLAPLVHYLEQGAAEGLPVGPAFDATYYGAVYADVRASGLPPLAHFLRIGQSEGRYPKARPPSPIDLFDDTAVGAYAPAAPERIDNEADAVRFLVALLRARLDLRRRFPEALSDGAEGTFAAWLAGDGAAELDLPHEALAPIAAAFRADPGARIRQLRLIRGDVAFQHPLALTPAGAGDLLAAVAADGTLGGEPVDPGCLWWFLLSVAERPAAGLIETFLFTPVWQRLFPDGITLFGRRALADWLVTAFGIADDWADPTRWPAPLTPSEQIRLAHAARGAWQASHPVPFADVAAAGAFLVWLGTPAAGLDGEMATWLARQDRAALATALAAPGLNMLGHFCYASGLRTSTEALVEGFCRVGGEVSLRDVWVQARGDEDRHAAYAGLEVHDVTIIHTQPEPLFDVTYARAGLAPRNPRTYRIGYWYWELETIPEHWQAQADQVDEIWAATSFVGNALKERFDLPVHVIMPGLEHPVFVRRSRAHFGLPEGTFLFLFTFHMASIMERKNPLGLIEAFITAFSKDDGVGLVLKTSFGHLYPEQLAELRAACVGYNVITIDALYSEGDVLALMDVCDAYVSLHRSEGYGLTMAEAMLLGKPVIATGYSGNLDFMTEETSLLVRYKLVTLDRDYPPYKAGTRWAHASLTHAAECMRKVRDNPEWARAIGVKAKVDLATRMSFKTSGGKVAARISVIGTARSKTLFAN